MQHPAGAREPDMEFELGTALEVLRRTPWALRALLGGLDRRWTDRDYGDGTWSPREVVAHLIYGERTDWIPRARRIMERGESVPFDPFDRAGHKALLEGKSIGELLDEFEHVRAESLAALQEMAVSGADLDKRGTHPAFGSVQLRQLLATWAVHDLNHIAQVCKGMAHQYRDAVGPWEAYLSVLAPPNPR